MMTSKGMHHDQFEDVYEDAPHRFSDEVRFSYHDEQHLFKPTNRDGKNS